MVVATILSIARGYLQKLRALIRINDACKVLTCYPETAKQ